MELTKEEYIKRIFGEPQRIENIMANEQIHDPVNKPSHYMLTDTLEVRDVLAALVVKLKDSNKAPPSALFESDYVQMMQYLMRFMDKNGKQDLEKARWYLDKMINAYD
jgi:hypothetical protein